MQDALKLRVDQSILPVLPELAYHVHKVHVECTAKKTSYSISIGSLFGILRDPT